MKRIELLCPAGSLANLKAAVSKGADAVYLGLNRFSARQYATNFNLDYLKKAVKICRSNDVKIFLTMNTLVKNHEIKGFFDTLNKAYIAGIDAVIIQEISFITLIKRSFPGLKVHISTQAGILNSGHAKLLEQANRINLSRELNCGEIKVIRKNFSKEIEVFCHGALCVSISGNCLFSSFIGGRSGNRGRCAQPCRRRYDNRFLISTKDLCLIEKIPEIVKLGIDSVKIEGRMRTPYYTAKSTEMYKKAINSYYDKKLIAAKDMKKELYDAFSREFTVGGFGKAEDIINIKDSSGRSKIVKKEFYEVKVNDVKIKDRKSELKLPKIEEKRSLKKNLIVDVYSYDDAIIASDNGADIIFVDIYSKDFLKIKKKVICKIYAKTPRIMLDSDISRLKELIIKYKPDGIFAGNLGVLNIIKDLPIILDYNNNIFNDISLRYVSEKNAVPVISPELSIKELKQFKDKNFIVFVHGKLRLMTLRHALKEGGMKDEKKAVFHVNKIHNGTEILNHKELGLLSKSSELVNSGINNFLIDTDKNVGDIVKFYRNILDNKKISDKKLKQDYVLGWSFRGVE